MKLNLDSPTTNLFITLHRLGIYSDAKIRFVIYLLNLPKQPFEGKPFPGPIQ